MRIRTVLTLFFLCLCLGLGSCGQKGPLRAPDTQSLAG